MTCHLWMIGIMALGSLWVFGADNFPAAKPPRALVQKVADAVLRDFPNPPPFDWGEGVLMTGMMRAHRLTKDPRCLDFVRRFADHWEQKGIEPLMNQKGYCGHWGPAYPVLMLYEETHDPRYRQLSSQVSRFIMAKSGRTTEGAWNHFFTPPELWVDTLFMGCPILSLDSKISNDPKLQTESARQIELFARHLQNQETGLFYHRWNEANGARTTNFWARGNGWVAMSCVEVLKYDPRPSPVRTRLEATFKRQMAGIIARQDNSSGLWHTLLEAPETYLETSASAMFLYAIAEGRNAKLLDSTYDAAAKRAWAGLCRNVDNQGKITGVSGGTMPWPKERYATVPQGTYPWGTGAFLMAACAYAEAGQ